ncbi:DUF2218 domain-containing protein [Rhizobiales bacterium RZME27]|uniref:DUF2218 domain-containing protein n=1 Tax=Endobacterium cereale TaxID=2663029 RepID=A0A6A8AD11_9HYPH|nr:DUF2218 domain-containing protein [Endobacterium cereale]MEB2847345.1 DUF2218 domain-containing protein [Endobacterium cereale]MQY49195.1 DUF2218 domain-containing protein [Endobacterium cereale]
MIATATTVQTENARKYITQLCKHFAHRVDVSHSEGHGECRFVCGTAVLDANEELLRIRITAPDEDQLKETQAVIESHLLRFAFRENMQPLQWSAPAPQVG